MKNTLFERFAEPSMKLGLIVLAIATLLLAYQALVVVPREEIKAKERLAAEASLKEEQARIARDTRYNGCVHDAEYNYNNRWEGHCVLVGKGENCSLPAYVADKFEEKLVEDKKQCLDIYKNY